MKKYYITCQSMDHPDGPAILFGPHYTYESALFEVYCNSPTINSTASCQNRHCIGWGDYSEARESVAARMYESYLAGRVITHFMEQDRSNLANFLDGGMEATINMITNPKRGHHDGEV